MTNSHAEQGILERTNQTDVVLFTGIRAVSGWMQGA